MTKEDDVCIKSQENFNEMELIVSDTGEDGIRKTLSRWPQESENIPKLLGPFDSFNGFSEEVAQ